MINNTSIKINNEFKLNIFHSKGNLKINSRIEYWRSLFKDIENFIGVNLSELRKGVASNVG
jgi:hypothetical protein